MGFKRALNRALNAALNTAMGAQKKPTQKDLTRAIATPGRSGARTVWGGMQGAITPQALSSILKASNTGDTRGYLAIAEKMEETDPHYASVLGTRKRAISGVAPRVIAAGEDPQSEKIAQAVRDYIATHDDFPALIEGMLDAIGKGFSVTEIFWQSQSGLWVPGEFARIDPAWFAFDKADGKTLRLIDAQNAQVTHELQTYKFIPYFAAQKSGLPVRGGMARLVAFGWICKNYALKDWARFIETYGLPIRLGKYDTHADEEDRDALFRAVRDIASDAGAVIPQDMDLTLIDTAKSDGGKVFENLARFVDEQISKAVLGQTMTSDNGASMAQANVHNEVRHDVAKADARGISGALNRHLVRPFIDLNFGSQARYPKIEIEIVEPEDLNLILTHTTALVDRGLRIRQSDIRAKLGFPDPDDDDELLRPSKEVGQQDAQTKTPTKAAQNRAEPQAQAGLADAAWEEILKDEAKFANLAQNAVATLLAEIEGAENYDAAAQILETHLPNVEGDVIETMIMGLFEARALGDVRDG